MNCPRLAWFSEYRGIPVDCLTPRISQTNSINASLQTVINSLDDFRMCRNKETFSLKVSGGKKTVGIYHVYYGR